MLFNIEKEKLNKKSIILNSNKMELNATRNDIELMAPVGSYESLMAAIQAGANSVYFGVEQLNMRAKSSINFTLNDLRNITTIAQEHNLRTYLTINTVIYNEEIILMRQIVDAAKESGITAIIASDMAVIQYARSQGVEVHISTQLNVSNIEAVRFYAQFADVVVLARELNLKQMVEITQTIENEQIKGPKGELIKIEIFVHGALCMAISGKCYLSLHEFNYSANRGSCLQTCRRGYTVIDNESDYQLNIDNEYIMSPKDLCTIGFLDKILKAGVRVLKIEGRARPPEYVKTVAQCYNQAIEAIFEHTFSPEKIEIWTEQLKTVFNRGFWDGYYLGRKMGEWNNRYGSQATMRKEYVAKVTNYFSKLNVAELLVEAGNLTIGDKILVTGPTTGVFETVVQEIRFDLQPVNQAIKGQSISIPCNEILRRADKVFKLIAVEDEF